MFSRISVSACVSLYARYGDEIDALPMQSARDLAPSQRSVAFESGASHNYARASFEFIAHHRPNVNVFDSPVNAMLLFDWSPHYAFVEADHLRWLELLIPLRCMSIIENCDAAEVLELARHFGAVQVVRERSQKFFEGPGRRVLFIFRGPIALDSLRGEFTLLNR